MNIGRNEKCPCESGKKFKNCCINDPKNAATQLNNDTSSKFLLTMHLQRTTVCSKRLEDTVCTVSPF